MLKKTASLILCVMMLVSCFTMASPSCLAAAESVSDLQSLALKFPHGKYWNHIGSKENNPDGYTSTPCTKHSSRCDYQEGACECNSFLNAIQCRGYAFKLANEITGSDPRQWSKSYRLSSSSLRVGDIIRYLNDGHSIVVVGIKGNTIAFTGANWGGNCLIKWGTMSLSSIRGFSYVLHQKGNNRKNSDLYFYNDLPEEVTIKAEKEEAQSLEKWKMVGDASLNIRKSPSVKSKVVGSIPVGKTFFVSDKKLKGGYLWGKVKYGSKEGWAALNYSEYISGAYEKPVVAPFNEVCEGSKVKVSWSKVDGASKYILCLYDNEGNRILKKSTKKTSYTLKPSEAGVYYVKVTAKSSKASSWKITSESEGFIFAGAHKKTGCSFAPDAPSKLKISNRSEASYTLSWSKVENAESYVIYKYSSENKAYEVFKTTNKNKIEISESSISRFKVSAITLEGETAHESALSKEIYGFAKPSAVTFSATPKKQCVNLSWEKTDNASGYIIYQKTNGKFEEIYRCSSSKSSFSVKNLKSGKKYSFKIRAFTKKGSQTAYGDFSGILSVKTK